MLRLASIAMSPFTHGGQSNAEPTSRINSNIAAVNFYIKLGEHTWDIVGARGVPVWTVTVMVFTAAFAIITDCDFIFITNVTDRVGVGTRS